MTTHHQLRNTEGPDHHSEPARRRRRRVTVAALLGGCLLALAACGGASSAGSTSTTTTAPRSFTPPSTLPGAIRHGRRHQRPDPRSAGVEQSNVGDVHGSDHVQPDDQRFAGQRNRGFVRDGHRRPTHGLVRVTIVNVIDVQHSADLGDGNLCPSQPASIRKVHRRDSLRRRHRGRRLRCGRPGRIRDTGFRQWSAVRRVRRR